MVSVKSPKVWASTILTASLLCSGVVPALAAVQTPVPSQSAGTLQDGAGQSSVTSSVYELQQTAVAQDVYLVPMTERRSLEITLAGAVSPAEVSWTLGGKPLSEWKSWKAGRQGTAGTYSGAPFVNASAPVGSDSGLTYMINFDLLYGVEDLNGSVRREYPKMMQTVDLVAAGSKGELYRRAIKIVPYDSFHTFEEIKPAIDAITADARADRYIDYRVLGKSVQGRDIQMSIVAKDKASVDQYLNETLPLMMNDPEELQNRIRSGELQDYKVPVWINNIHPDEAPGIDAIVKLFRTVAQEEQVTYDTVDDQGNPQQVTVNVDEALDNVIFLLNYTENPDGRVANTRANANGLDLNRDNSYQTQPETQIVTSEIAKWSPLSFLDMHGFVKEFLIEPCTPPHDPNAEYDLLIDHMVEQAEQMGRAGIANTKYDQFHIPYEEARKSAENPNYEPYGYSSGWDDFSPAYTAVFAMHHGALGHTIEIPEISEASVDALYYTALASTNYVMNNKDELFLNQLEIYKRGIEGIDSRTVDPYLVNADYEPIGRPRDGESSFFPEYYVLPVDRELQKNPLETYRMVNYLNRNGVNVAKTTAPVTVGDVIYPAGSYVVDMHQAKRGYANLVLYKGADVSDFAEMYAEVVQNFPEMRGFDRYTVREAGAFAGKTTAVGQETIPVTSVQAGASYYVVKNSNNDAVHAVNTLLKQGKPVYFIQASGQGYEMGDYLIGGREFAAIRNSYLLGAVPLSGSVQVKALISPKVAAVGSGENTFALNQMGFSLVTDQVQGDVIVSDGGAVDTKLVAAGRPFVGFGNSPLGQMKKADILNGFDYGYTAASHEGLFRTILNQNNTVTAEYPLEDYFYTASGSWITSVPDNADVVAQISGENGFYLAGWWPGHEKAQGQVLGIATKQDQDTANPNVVLFANDLVNRDHPQNQYRIVANAIFTTVMEQAPVTTISSGTSSGGSDRDDDDDKTLTGSDGATTPVEPAGPAGPAEPETTTESDSVTDTPALPVVEFKDLQEVGIWAHAAIGRLASMGIINGIGEGRFAPLKEVTRAEFLTMLLRAFPMENTGTSVSFSDTNSSAWYFEYVSTAVNAGIVSGVGGGKFEPNRPITREEMAIMSANVLKAVKNKQVNNAEETLASFSDRGRIASYAMDSVALLYQEGVIRGMTETTFVPKGVANRAQAAVILSNLLDVE
ncbi:S-layer homology domain-containing protein [Paenibacillus sp. P96]|uniref:S-layer homology domain-containing protein n=1 Tax=Paenibacillus zeirhizosphaerae TaxID=2987519 RepID=A0ABT9FX13_9BACL|nr:S-layer homology domain-containing protein [Paenibacillus sp. P96]MDP4099274.1 S-layer homology domain-containing protein [Paenibacillus sp. P96]